VGGIRVSLYNAMTLDGANQLAEFMEAFKKAN
jgi:phosphoserine aminotransferase